MRRLSLVAVLLSLAAAAPAPAVLPPWERAFLAAPAAEVLAAAAGVTRPAGAKAVILFEEGSYVYDDALRATYRYRHVYLVLSPAGVDELDTFMAFWSPWYEERPVLRGRVVTPDGQEFAFDPATLAEKPLSPGADLYDDRRLLSAPLPRIVPGSVVETEITVVDKQTYFAGGTVSRFYFGGSNPMEKVRLVVDLPEKASFRSSTVLLPDLKPRRETAKGRTRWTFEASGLAPLPPGEEMLPPDVPAEPVVAFTTGVSWADVATRYAKIVDERLAGAALTDAVAELTAGGAAPEVVAERALAWMKRRVRYTGLEVGANGVVPWTPAETLARGFGDCKDQAALLVGLLRAAGLKANVALLDSGGEDIDPTLPGLAFDHAIVVVAGQDPLWIDPTDDHPRPGFLPLGDRDRWALIAAPGTRALVRTPPLRAADVTWNETRAFTLAEEGPAGLVVTTEPHGLAEAYQRAYAVGESAAEHHRRVASSFTSTWSGAVVERVERGAAEDWSQPYREVVAASHVEAGHTYSDGAVVYIRADGPLSSLPDEMSEPGPARKQDRAFVPFVDEVRYRITPPPGCSLPSLPAADEAPIGPLRLSRSYTVEGGDFVASFRLTVDRRRFTAAEVEEVRKAVAAYRKKAEVRLFFENIAHAEQKAGRSLEAIAEHRRLIALHPAEARHHADLAELYLQLGLGDAARDEVRRGLAVEPGAASAQFSLAWILEHDRFGRRDVAGSDRAGAVAAYRRTLELGPELDDARWRYAELLGRNPTGLRHGPGAAVDEAVTQYRALQARDNHEHDLELAQALVFLGRYAEARDVLRALDAGDERNALLVAAVALAEDAAAAVREAATIASTGEKRAGLLTLAGAVVAGQRLYPLASTLTDEAGRLIALERDLRTWRDVLALTRPYDRKRAVGRDPVAVTTRAFLSVFSEKGKPDAALFASPAALEDLAGQRAGLGNTLDVFSQLTQHTEKPEFLGDFFVAAAEIAVDGAASSVWRVHISPRFPGQRTYVYLVAAKDGSPRLAAGSGALGALGPEIVRLAKAGDLAGARQLLDWARGEAAEPAADATLGAPFPRFWTVGSKGEKDAVLLAGAVLGATTDAKGLLPTLERCATLAPANAASCDIVLAHVYWKLERWNDMLAAAERALGRVPDSSSAVDLVCRAYFGLHADDRLAAFLAERLARKADDPPLLRIRANLAMRRGETAAARVDLARLVALGEAREMDLNNLGWLAVVDGAELADAIGYADRSLGLADRPSTHNTLAALLVEDARYSEVYTHMVASLADHEPEAQDWYVHGRLAERLGLAEIAAASYREAAKDPEAEGTSSGTLARRRLTALGQKP